MTSTDTHMDSVCVAPGIPLSETPTAVEVPDETDAHLLGLRNPIFEKACNYPHSYFIHFRTKMEKENAMVASLFTGTKISFVVNGLPTVWKIGRRLNDEKTIYDETCDGGHRGISAVFDCSEVEDGIVYSDDRAVCKIYIEIFDLHENSKMGPSKRWMNKRIMNEIEALRRLTATGDDNPGPHFLASQHMTYMDGPASYGGPAHLILMQKLPGTTLDRKLFWSFSLETRNEIRSAFLQARRNLFKAGIRHNDNALRNLIWDEESKRCYIIDFEDIRFLHEAEVDKFLAYINEEGACINWGLRKARVYWCGDDKGL